MEAFEAFAVIVPYLTHPLALVGFVLLLVFGIHRTLIRSGVIPPVSPHVGGRLLQSLLRYGFVIALCVIVLGFLWRYLDFLNDTQRIQAEHRAELAEQATVVLEERLRDKEAQIGVAELRTRGLQEQAQMLSEAVNALVHEDDPDGDEALEQLAQGNTAAANAFFERVIGREPADVVETAEAWRHLGALAYLDDTEKALAAYRRATALDPNDPAGWLQLGGLLFRRGNLDEAASAFERVQTLAAASRDDALQAVAFAHLGDVVRIRSDLEQAEDMQLQTLEESAKPGIVAMPASPLSAIVIKPLTLKGFPKIEEIYVLKPGARRDWAALSPVTDSKVADKKMIVAAGTYDIAYKAAGTRSPSATVLVAGLEVPPQETVNVHMDSVAAAITVPKMVGIDQKGTYVVGAGARRDSFAVITHGGYYESAKDFGTVMMVTAGRQYDVLLDLGDDFLVPIAEKVVPQGGELLVIQ